MENNLCVDIAFIDIITFQQRLFSMDRIHMDLWVSWFWPQIGRNWCMIGKVLESNYHYFAIKGKRKISCEKFGYCRLLSFFWHWVFLFKWFFFFRWKTWVHSDSLSILVEHVLSVGSNLHFISVCQRKKDPVVEMVNSDVPYLFTNDERMPVWVAIGVKLISVYATFVWNFLDIFIMVISIALTTHFKLFNCELKQAKSEVIVILFYWIFEPFPWHLWMFIGII